MQYDNSRVDHSSGTRTLHINCVSVFYLVVWWTNMYNRLMVTDVLF